MSAIRFCCSGVRIFRSRSLTSFSRLAICFSWLPGQLQLLADKWWESVPRVRNVEALTSWPGPSRVPRPGHCETTVTTNTARAPRARPPIKDPFAH